LLISRRTGRKLHLLKPVRPNSLDTPESRPGEIFTNKYVSGDCPLSTHADPTSTRRAIFNERRICRVTFASAHLYDTINRTSFWLGRVLPVLFIVQCARWTIRRADFELLEEQSSRKWEILCLGRRRTALQNLTPLALSSEEKSVTVQTNKHKIKPIHTLPIGMRR